MPKRRKGLELKHKQSGFSITEALVTMMVVMIVASGLATVLVSAMKGQNNVRFRSEGDNFTEEVRSLLSSVKACSNNWGGGVSGGGIRPGPGLSFAVTDLKDATVPSGSIAYSAGSSYGASTANASPMTFVSGNLTNFRTSSAAHKAQMTLQLSLQTNKESSGAQMIQRQIEIALDLDSGGYVDSCVALARMSDGIWQRGPANLNNIFFAAVPSATLGGNVGIGRESVMWPLEIHRQDEWAAVGAWTHDSGTAGQQFSPHFMGLFARGTQSSPLHPRQNDQLVSFDGRNGLNPASALNGGSGFKVFAAENHTATSQATRLDFYTVASGTVNPGIRMTLSQSGRLGIGTTLPQTTLHVNTGGVSNEGVLITSARQAYLAAQGAGDSGSTKSALYLSGAGASFTETDSWYLAHKSTPDRQLHIGRWDGGSNVTHLLISRSGNVGIGTPGTSDPSERLVVNGNVQVSGVVTASSDRRLKREIRDLVESVPDAIDRLRPVSYVRASQAATGDLRREIGFIAQDVEDVFPEFVRTGGDGMKSVNYSQMVAVLAKGVQDLRRRAHACEGEALSLKARIQSLEERMQALEARLNRTSAQNP